MTASTPSAPYRRTRARFRRYVAAPGGTAPHRPRRVAQGGHERLLPAAGPQVFALLDVGRALIARSLDGSRPCSRSSRRSDPSHRRRLIGIVAGGLLVPFRPALPRPLAPGGGRVRAWGRGLWALADDGTWGSASRATLRRAFGVDGLTGVFLATLPSSPSRRSCSPPPTCRARGGRVTGVLSAAFLLALIGILCRATRSRSCFLGADDARSGRDHPRRERHRGRSTHGLHYVAITHLGGAGTWLRCSAGARGSDRRPDRARRRLRRAGRDRDRRDHRFRDEGRPDAAARVASTRPSDRTGVYLGPDERRHGRGSGVWADPRTRRLARRAPSGSVPRFSPSAVSPRSAVSPTPSFSAISSGCWRTRRSSISASSLLGLGACLLLRHLGADQWAAFAFGAALLHTVNHAAFKALLFLGAGTFERATGGLELDRLGGLLRRRPGAAARFSSVRAIAGIPLLNGFASEWLTLQALLPPGLRRSRGRHAGALALAALALTMAIAWTASSR